MNLNIRTHLTLALFAFILLGTQTAAAKETEQIIPTEMNSENPSTINEITPHEPLKISDREAFLRTEAVLNNYQVPVESDPSSDLMDLDGVQSLNSINQLIPFFDPTRLWRQLSTISPDQLFVFQDKESKQTLDFQLRLRPGHTEAFPKNLPSISDDPLSNLPLSGLRIALDPGHMGSSFWDTETGKYVQDDQGHKISEGILNLQTCLLLKTELEKLGAQVMLTHNGLSAVTNIDYKNFDIRPWAQSELREEIHSAWFTKLISQFPVGPALYQAFDQSPERKLLFSERSRGTYFIRRADLWARVEKIDQFKPDIVLIIHYDTDEFSPSKPNAVNPKAPKETKAFVVGSYQQNELGSRESRKYFARHLLNQNSWDESLKLSRSLVKSMSQNLNLKLALSADSGTLPVEPGIHARNLVMPRRLKAPVISYLECLFYNNPEEFNLFLKANHPMLIDGQNIPYADRTWQVAQAIKTGILDYVQNRGH